MNQNKCNFVSYFTKYHFLWVQRPNKYFVESLRFLYTCILSDLSVSPPKTKVYTLTSSFPPLCDDGKTASLTLSL